MCDCLCSVLEALQSHCNPGIRPIFKVSNVVEQYGPVALTHQFRGPKPPRRSLIMLVAMSASQQCMLTIVKFVDKKGNPAQVDGIPSWSTDNTDVLALTPAADGMSCLVKAAGPLGNAKVTMQADADLGDGVSPIFGTVDFEITAGAAVAVELEASTPVEQP